MPNLNACTVFLATVLLAACAADPGTAPQAGASDCYSPEPRVGTQIVRRERCVESTPESREEARRALEEMQRRQERAHPPKAPGGG